MFGEWPTRTCLKLKALIKRRQFEQNLEEELQFHLAMREEKERRAGVAALDARDSAHRQFGNSTSLKERCREMWTFVSLESLWQDIRYGLRILRANSAFTTVAILSLALGIGANTAIFSLIDAILLRDLPVRDPNQLVEVMPANHNGDNAGVSMPMLEEFRRRQQVFSSMAAWWGGGLATVEINHTKARAGLWAVDGDFYSELGVSPLLGRFITPADVNLHGGAPVQVAVLGYDFWRSRLGGDAGVIGRMMRIEDLPFEIIGVTREEFTGMRIDTQPAITIPITAEPLVFGEPLEHAYDRGWLALDVTARLKDGITLAQANAQLQALWPSVRAEMVPPNYSSFQRQELLSNRLAVKSAAKGFTPLHKRFVEPLYILMAIAGLVLLIACVNLASLLVSRAATRGHEISVRVALGAGRLRLVRQLLAESVILSLSGAAVGLVLAQWSSKALAGFILNQLSFTAGRLNLGPDTHVLAFTAAIAILTGILFGLAPALNATRRGFTTSLQESSRIVGSARSGRFLVSTQIALSLVLLMSAALFLRSLAKLRAANPGFQTVGILEAGLIENTLASKTLDAPVYYRELLGRIEQLPGVVSAAMSENEPASNFQNKVSVAAESPGPNNPSFEADLEMFSPGAFRTLGIRLEQGRDFAWTDDKKAPSVAVVSESLAWQLFPCGNALGRRIIVGPDNFPFKQRNLQVIGLVSDATFWNIRERNSPELYIPALQSYMQYGELLVHANMDPLALASSVREAVDSMGHEYVLQTQSLSEQVERSLLQERVTAMFSAFFGGLALLLASIGLYGVMSYAVTRRTREIGIRLALGAQPPRVLWMVLGETLALLLAGIAIGIPFALLGTHLIAKQLFGLSPRDPLTLGIVVLALVAVGILAGYLPARRATRVDPIMALRHE